MAKVQNNRGISGASLPPKKKLSPEEQCRSDEVENVLEHVTSPFRWELLEVPLVKPKTSVPKNSAKQKTR
jgi:hypothetical protein